MGAVGSWDRFMRHRSRLSVATALVFLATVLATPDRAAAAAPDTTITGGPSGTVAERTATFSFSSSQSRSTYECLLDTGKWISCTPPHTYTNLADGAHTFFGTRTESQG